MLDYKKELNDAQYQAVTEYSNASLVVAGAGSGKTRVLTYRIAYMIEQGILPSKIMGLTFTNKAAKEMKERIVRLVSSNKKRILLGTFHSIFAKILRAEAKTINFTRDFSIYDSDDSKSLIRNIVKDIQLDKKVYKESVVAARISAAKNRIITATMYDSIPELRKRDEFAKVPELSKIYLLYEKRCKKANAMDFDDLLLNTYFLFKNSHETLSHYQDIFEYFLVDEFQDTNIVQYEIIKMLASKSGKLCCVGDDAQSIYSFRGAQINNIKKFRDDFNAQIFRLEQNYRSTKTIVNAANELIKKNKNQIPKNLFSENLVGEKLSLNELGSDIEEGAFIAEDIKLKMLTNHLIYNDFAILYRTNKQSRILEEALRGENIPYRVYGGFSFYQRKEVKDILAYLSVILNPYDEVSLLRIINFPKRGIGDTTIANLQQVAFSMKQTLWEVMQNITDIETGFSPSVSLKINEFVSKLAALQKLKTSANVFEIAEKLVKDFEIINYYNSDDVLIEKKENVEELLRSIYEFVSENDSDEEKDVYLTSYMQTVALITDMDKQKPEDQNSVKLMTVHSAKGLEFPVVYIAGLEDGLFPSSMSMDSPYQLQEERRLFYVAITRAMQDVILSFCQTRYRYNQQEYPIPSRFLFELDKRYYDFSGTNPHFKFGKPIQKNTLTASSFNKVTSKNNLKKITSQDVSMPNRHQNHDIRIGMVVAHPKFGSGKVLHIEGQCQNTKAIIFFEKVGEKTLLLKFAKLSVITY